MKHHTIPFELMAKKTFVKKTWDETFDPHFFQVQVSLAPCFET